MKLNIPGYGKLDTGNEKSVEAFRFHYQGLIHVIQALRGEVARAELYPHKVSITIVIDGGRLSEVVSKDADMITATLIDLDSITQGDILVTEGNFPVTTTDISLDEYVSNCGGNLTPEEDLPF